MATISYEHLRERSDPELRAIPDEKCTTLTLETSCYTNDKYCMEVQCLARRVEFNIITSSDVPGDFVKPTVELYDAIGQRLDLESFIGTIGYYTFRGVECFKLVSEYPGYLRLQIVYHLPIHLLEKFPVEIFDNKAARLHSYYSENYPWGGMAVEQWLNPETRERQTREFEKHRSS